MDLHPVLDFAFELGLLRRIPRTGWAKIGSTEEDVAQHVMRTAQIAFVLAVMEKHPHPEHVATLALFHDNAETRSGDQNRLAKRYVIVDAAFIVAEQTQELGEAGEKLLAIWQEAEEKQTPAAKIAKDADYLEMAISAFELNAARGNDRAQPWIDGVIDALKTDSAKHVAAQLKTANPDAWWRRAEAQ